MSKIEWTERTWNPLAGCSDKSPGCTNCYAKTMAARLEAMGQAKYAGLTVLQGSHLVWTGKIGFDEEALLAPLKRKKPTTYFVNSMSDLFHENVTNKQIDRIFAVMALCPQHTFQVLTKRPERMLAYITSRARHQATSWSLSDSTAWHVWAVTEHYQSIMKGLNHNPFMSSPDKSSIIGWPLPNVWLGVSTERQKEADERIPLLLQTPAAIRFISAEPLLGPLDISRWLWPMCWHWDAKFRTPEEAKAAGAYAELKPQGLVSAYATFLDLAIVGGESGRKARPMNPAWVYSLNEQCRTAGAAFFFKQWGEWVGADHPLFGQLPARRICHIKSNGEVWKQSELPQDENADVITMKRVGKKMAKAILFGDKTIQQLPEVKRAS